MTTLLPVSWPSADAQIVDANGRATPEFRRLNDQVRRWIGGVDTYNAFNAVMWGCDPTGAADCGAIINRMLAAFGPYGGAIYFPAGRYLITTPVDFTYPTPASVSYRYGVQILGDGIGATQFYTESAITMLSFALRDYWHAISMSDMSFVCGRAGGATALYLTTDHSLATFARKGFYNLDFGGKGDGVGTNYWDTCAIVENVCGTSWDSCSFLGSASFQGDGLQFVGTGSGQTAIMHDVAKCHFLTMDDAIIYDTEAQGITVEQTNFLAMRGIYVPSGSNQVQLNVSDCQFDARGASAILIDNAMSLVSIDSNMFIISTNNHVAVDLGASVYVTISGGNQFLRVGGTGTTGIRFNGFNTMITGNVFAELALGIDCDTGAGFSNIQSNRYSNCTVNVGGVAVGGVTVGGGSP